MALLSQILAVKFKIKVGFWSTFLTEFHDFSFEKFQNPKIFDQKPAFKNKLDHEKYQ